MYEILAPAGNKECALAAVDSGADALYLGYSAFSARASAENFDLSALKEIIDYAHAFGVKIYVTMNTMVKESELAEFLATLISVHNAGADGILLQDIFLGKYIHERYPDVCLHLSTQAGCNNVYGARLAKEYGFSRVVLARETDIADIREIAKIIETEVFVQGALCTCFSGQCYFSSFIGGNSGNRGRCKQPCRKRYTYDTGEKKECYALSLSDLSVGERVEELLSAGVYSLKIEGRMRRPEYVAAAVRYYKRLLQGEQTAGNLSDLKRSYNRGNYTAGLAFGQDKRLLSTSVQGHIGEKVGVVKVLNGQYYVESREKFTEGDGFKVLREGGEVGGATFVKSDKRGFYIGSKSRLKNGDGVFVTTDTALNDRLVWKEHRKLPVKITVKGREGERLVAVAPEWGIEVRSDFLLQTAKSSPLGIQEVTECFLKTDEYPIKPEVTTEIVGNCFVPKSQMNGLRRTFFAKLYARLTENKNTQYEYVPVERVAFGGKNKKIAGMGATFEGLAPDICIVKPSDYGQIELPRGGEKYLYLPPFLGQADVERLQKTDLSAFDGIYAEGTYGILLARQWNKKLFAGTGFNLSNSIAVNEVRKVAEYYALSKELSLCEQEGLTSEKSFILSAGSIKVMDLIYCPFGKRCGQCEDRKDYTLTDEGSRSFPVRRYRLNGACRFEVYNCAYLLAPQSITGSLIDLSTVPVSAREELIKENIDQEKVKKALFPVTNGHSKKSVL